MPSLHIAKGSPRHNCYQPAERLLEGKLPRKARALVAEWTAGAEKGTVKISRAELPVAADAGPPVRFLKVRCWAGGPVRLN